MSYEMFSDAGNEAVRRALEGRLEAVRNFRELGFTPTDEWVQKMIDGVQQEVAERGFPEVHDTAVREQLWAAFDDRTGKSEFELAEERMVSLGKAAARARDEATNAVAEVLRLTLLKLAETRPKMTGLSYEVSYEYDDEGGYFQSATVYPVPTPDDMFDDEFSDAISGFGIPALATLCGETEDSDQGAVTLTEARERRF